MTSSAAPPIPDATDVAPIGFREFVGLVAALMSLTALGIDSMLSALPAIGHSLGVDAPNDRQWVVTTFLIGFGVFQLVHGPLADRYGRKPVLAGALGIYVVANIACAVAASFPLLLVARFVGGAAIAASRVCAVALVRDCFRGGAMARVMSLAFIVFMAAPIVAPSVGQAVLLVGSWRLIFWAVAGATAIVLGWFAWRMPETLSPNARRALSVGRLAQGWGTTLSDRASIGYTLASTLLLGALYGYLNSIQQIMTVVFARPQWLGGVFAVTAATMAVANLLNARIVIAVGSRRISHWALAVLIGLSALNVGWWWWGGDGLVRFAILQALTMGCFGLASSNFSAMAMERMGAIAGTASSMQGFVSIVAGALAGAVIGQAFDGTTLPLHLGFLVAGLLALGIVAIVERGRLFHAA